MVLVVVMSVCYDLPLPKTGINPIIAWKCFAYFFILLKYITGYHLVQVCVRPVKTLETHT